MLTFYRCWLTSQVSYQSLFTINFLILFFLKKLFDSIIYIIQVEQLMTIQSNWQHACHINKSLDNNQLSAKNFFTFHLDKTQ